MQKIDLTTVKNILFCRSDAIGDIILALPAIYHIKTSYPHLRITLLASNYSQNGCLIEHLPFIDDVIIAPTFNEKKSFRNFVTLLKEKAFDVAIHFSTNEKIAWASFFSIPKNVGDTAILGLYPVFRKYGRFYPPHHVISHQVRSHFFQLECFGIPTDTYKKASLVSIYTDQEQEKIDLLLKQKGRDTSKPLIGIHIGAAGGNKPVLPNKYIAYIQALRNLIDCDICFTGYSEEEQGFRDEIVKHAPGPFLDFVGECSLIDLIALIHRMNVFVGIDTGPTHMAASMGIPILLLSTSKRVLPFKWGPWLTPHYVVRDNDNCTITCHARQCPEWLCSDELNVTTMVESTQKLLNGQGIQSFEDQERHWFKSCMHTLILYDKSTQEAAQNYEKLCIALGFKVFSLPNNHKDIYQFCADKNIHIIHNFPQNKKLKLLILSQKLNAHLSNPPLVIHSNQVQNTAADIIDSYRKAFEKRVYL